MQKRKSHTAKQRKPGQKTIAVLVFLMFSVSALYFIYTLIPLVFFSSTEGEIVSTTVHTESASLPRGRGISGNYQFTTSTVWYKYQVQDRKYAGSRIAYLIIYPDTKYTNGEHIPVYYSVINNSDAVLFRGSTEYYIYNFVPLLALGLISLYIKVKWKL